LGPGKTQHQQQGKQRTALEIDSQQKGGKGEGYGMGFELPQSLTPSPLSQEHGDGGNYVTETEAASGKPTGGGPGEVSGNLFYQTH
jgi:hypothetical protein